MEIFLCDLFDIEFYGDPFKLIRPGYLCVGSEGDRGIFIRKKQRRVYGHTHYDDRVALNAGIIGARRPDMVRLLKVMVSDLRTVKPHINGNMGVLNYRAWQLFDGRIITGKPLHSKFKAYDKSGNGYTIRHK